MIALIIVGGIALLIAIILNLPVVLVADYENETRMSLKILFFDLLKEKKTKKPKKQKPNVGRAAPGAPPIKQNPGAPPIKQTPGAPPMAQTMQNPAKPIKPTKTKKAKKQKPPKQKQKFDFAQIKLIINSFAKPLKKLMRKIKISELRIDSVVGGSDAAKAALNYGAQSAALYSAIAWLKSISNVKIERIDIQADFMNEESRFDLHFKAKAKVGTLLVCILAFMAGMAKLSSPPPRKSQKAGIGKSIRIVMD